jgi:hypothetical protein
MIESSIQENGTMDSKLNLLIAFTAILENLIIVENIFGGKGYKVHVCGTKELESNMIHKLGVDLI